MQTETLPALPAPPALDVALGVRLPFRRRALLGALLAGILFLFVAGALAWRQYDDARASEINDARTRVLLTAGIFDEYFSGQISALAAIAQAPPVRARDERGMDAYFRRVSAPFSGAAGLGRRQGRPPRLHRQGACDDGLRGGPRLLPPGHERPARPTSAPA